MNRFKNFLKLIFFVNVIPVAVDFVVYYVLTRTMKSTYLFSSSGPVSFGWVVTNTESGSYAMYTSMSQQISNLLSHPLIVVFGSIGVVIFTVMLIHKSFKPLFASNYTVSNLLKYLLLIYNFLLLKNLIAVALLTLAPSPEYYGSNMFKGFGDFVFFAIIYSGLSFSSLLYFFTGLISPLVMLTTSIIFLGIKRTLFVKFSK